ncbi:MAG TPA: glycoside hydrolase family 3 C-terminal domain-containing protein [Acidobacteriaceae bacterium]|nr:glycoside hydrolase family 3 C-terminal domain-containing protein [Acidobacteriaceae bacterium]
MGLGCLSLGLFGLHAAKAQGSAAPAAQTAPPQPWMNASLDPDMRADLMIHEMTLDEKIQLVHGAGWGVLRPGSPVAAGHNGGAGFVPGIPRLHLPDINLADSAVGVRMAAPQSRYATLLPSVIGLAASWDPDAAFLYGSVIGRELRAQGYNMSIGGGMDLIREPRNGRNFEYASEDPILAGTMVGQIARGVQSNHVMGDIKHYAVNDQETGRNILNAVLDKRALRETDLLAFQIAITAAHPAGVMCSYNHINGDYACENDYTLNQVLKKDWGFQGFVLSDWGGTHSTVKAALAGLDMDQPGDDNFFSDPLKKAVQDGTVSQTRLDEMVHRIVRSMFVNGVIDQPPLRTVVDPFRGRDDAQKIEEESLVLLQNTGSMMPLSAAKTKSIAVIGGHADVAVLSGGGSAQVDSPGGNAIDPKPGSSPWGKAIYFPSSPMRYIREQALPGTKITYDEGTDPAQAAKAAASAQIAIVFVTQWMTEGQDSATLSLPDKQDDLVAAVAAANPNTIVVLENGGPVNMPWAGRVKGIVESWYPGIGGGEAIANILFGRVNPSGKLPVTFAASDDQLPHPKVTGLTERTGNNADAVTRTQPRQRPTEFDVDYNVEGMAVGYRWFQEKNLKPQFAFGFGLSYTRFAYSNLKVDAEAKSVSFDLRNAGTQAGDEIAEVYVTLPTSAGEPFRKLAGFKRVSLAAGASQTVQVALDPLYLSIYSPDTDKWSRPPGEFLIEVGGSSAELPLHSTVKLAAE